MKVALAAGHYPAKPGAAYREDGRLLMVEHDEALRWVRLLQAELEDGGAEWHLVPAVKLPMKVADVNDAGVDCAVEIHFNAALNNHGEYVGRGSETLFCPGSEAGAGLAGAIQERLAMVFAPDRGIKEGWYRMDVPDRVDYPDDRPGDEVPDYFLARTRCPAVIVEPEFVHHWKSIHERRHEGAAAIAAGILAWGLVR